MRPESRNHRTGEAARSRKLPGLPHNQLLRAAKSSLPGILHLIRTLVEIESPSDDKPAVDRCVAAVEQHCVAMGGEPRRHPQVQFGDLLEVRFGLRGSSLKPILLLGHLDTVWPLGTLGGMPFRVDNERASGPGVLDMKAGVAMALTALRILQEESLLERPLTLLLNSDEEVGSPASRPVTEKLASECEAVFVLEPAQGLQGAYKTARKGVGEFKVHIGGVAAHSGVDFERGHSAIAELARQIERIAAFTDLPSGLTVNLGVIGGGTRSNVIAAEAWAQVDVRIAKRSQAAKIQRLFHSLRPIDTACSIRVDGGVNRPPMERTPSTVRMFKQAARLARGMGFDLGEAATGGGSDGNFTSALGISTLDGMGAVGEGAHAPHEYLLIEHLAPRTALLAAMLLPHG
ncbi:MAG TPA: M20 family metallopeptidase [Acidisarcina sp.]